jgi:hypothetical protein
MNKLRAREKLIEEVCRIIAHHHQATEAENPNFKIVYDSDLIANLEERQTKAPMDREELLAFIGKSFLTESGRQEAEEVLLKNDKEKP